MTNQSADRLHPQRKPALEDWHAFLNPAEAVEVEALEANARQLDARRRGLTRDLQMWRTRCLQRRRERLMREARRIKTSAPETAQ